MNNRQLHFLLIKVLDPASRQEEFRTVVRASTHSAAARGFLHLMGENTEKMIQRTSPALWSLFSVPDYDIIVEPTTDPLEDLKEKVHAPICHITLERAIKGSCPTHHGDSCLVTLDGLVSHVRMETIHKIADLVESRDKELAGEIRFIHIK